MQVNLLTEKDTYCENDYDGANNPPTGDIYGDVNEDIEFQTIQNPYYAEELDNGPITIKTIQNPYYNEEI